ncbi:hypothetical protein SAMN02745225_02304 [Ferrithrix thermotolerans DSM 19514]|uniref:Uncharacterized protein n=1 Tax=Ferrithrix thermotolerans DSM 19514 TaxID=1121881 RepID=A0A1M4YCG5_9ACTN|nr:hypothetical protein SAMN02745225_02304 [Ferrithrix thermotolerans DSM 19514]
MPLAVRRGPDVAAVTAHARDEPGQEVLGVGVGEAPIISLASLGEQCLGLVEQVGVEQRLVGLVDDVAKGDLAEIATVAHDAEDDHGVLAPPGAGAMPVVVQLGGDSGCSYPTDAVAGEDPFDDRELGGSDGEVVVVVEKQPVVDGAARPSASGRLSLHAGDYAIDDRCPFELREDPEELDEHPPGRRRGVDWLGGRAEGHSDRVELFQEADEHLERTGEAVQPVDEQGVVEPEASVAQRLLERKPLGAGEGELVGVGLDVLPAGPAGDEGGKADFLGAKRGRLVLLVSGDPQVERDPGAFGGRLRCHGHLLRPGRDRAYLEETSTACLVSRPSRGDGRRGRRGARRPRRRPVPPSPGTSGSRWPVAAGPGEAVRLLRQWRG